MMLRAVAQRPGLAFRNGLLTSTTPARAFHSADLTVERSTDTSNYEKRPAKEEIQFGTTFADHMLVMKWNQENKWTHPAIIPYQDLKISPAASCLHYGLQCFEGMKAYRSVADDSIRLFRPDMNMKRLASSMGRLHMPGSDFDHTEMIECISQLVKFDEKWIPDGEGYSLYLRPTAIATHRSLGMGVPNDVMLYVFTCPVGPYFKGKFTPIKLTADSKYVRAWPGGTGNAKVGGNYGSTIKPAYEAAQEGYSQVLWLFGENDEITEVGAMNIFFFLINKETNKPELVTAPLTRGDILPGVTRDSILHLARAWGDFDVSERFLTMKEVKEAEEDGRLMEAFGAGTAAVVTPVSHILYKGKEIEIPATGALTKRVFDEVMGIQYGRIEGPKGWSVKI